MKGIREDFVSVAVVLAVVLGLASAIPRELIGFSASKEIGRPSSTAASIVFLDSAAVTRAMRATRILSRHEGDGTVVADLLATELPELVAEPMMPRAPRFHLEQPTVIEGGVPPFLPSRRAAAPLRIPVGKDVGSLPFSRDELLKLN